MLQFHGAFEVLRLAVAIHEANDVLDLVVTQFLFFFYELDVNGLHSLLGLCTFVDIHHGALDGTPCNKTQNLGRGKVLLFKFLVAFLDFIVANFVAAISEHLKYGLARSIEDAFVSKLANHFYYTLLL